MRDKWILDPRTQSWRALAREGSRGECGRRGRAGVGAAAATRVAAVVVAARAVRTTAAVYGGETAARSREIGLGVWGGRRRVAVEGAHTQHTLHPALGELARAARQTGRGSHSQSSSGCQCRPGWVPPVRGLELTNAHAGPLGCSILGFASWRRAGCLPATPCTPTC